MKARPRLFAGPMVRAMIEGRKTQTRRAMKPQPEATHDGYPYWHIGGYRAWEYMAVSDERRMGTHNPLKCPYGQPGDLLWVRETWAEGWTYAGERPAVFYRSTMDGLSHCQHALNYDRMLGASAPSGGMRWRPSIYMPRWASRLTLRITDVRVERLQDISEEDAIAEGINRIHHGDGDHYYHAIRTEPHPKNWVDPVDAFRELWQSINGPGSWDANPWAWRISFLVIQKNVDEVLHELAN